EEAASGDDDPGEREQVEPVDRRHAHLDAAQAERVEQVDHAAQGQPAHLGHPARPPVALLAQLVAQLGEVVDEAHGKISLWASNWVRWPPASRVWTALVTR